MPIWLAFTYSRGVVRLACARRMRHGLMVLRGKVATPVA
jgi:hypothetical protein